MTSNKTITANFVAVSSQQQVVSFTLMNATTDQAIRDLTHGETINLALGNNLNIRANTNPGVVGSVKMTLSLTNGTVVKTITETGAPYALFGDSNSNYNNWTPATGSYSLTAIPYSAAAGSGTAGTPLTINFNVVNQPVVTQYNLTVTAVNGTVTKSPNQTSYASGTNVNLAAVANPGYRFTGWSGGATGTANPLTVSMTSNKNITANFAAVTGQQVVSFTLMNATTDQAIRNIIPGEVINLAVGNNLNIRANTNPGTVGSVKMTLNLKSGTLVKTITETGAPYALFGDASGNYNNWTPAAGEYVLTATPYSAASGGGTVGTSLTVPFTVVNSATASRVSTSGQALEQSPGAANITVYPTPTTDGKVQVDLAKIVEEDVTYTLISLVGTKLAEGKVSVTQPTSVLSFDFSRQMQSSGAYYLLLESKTVKARLKLMKQ